MLDPRIAHDRQDLLWRMGRRVGDLAQRLDRFVVPVLAALPGLVEHLIDRPLDQQLVDRVRGRLLDRGAVAWIAGDVGAVHARPRQNCRRHRFRWRLVALLLADRDELLLGDVLRASEVAGFARRQHLTDLVLGPTFGLPARLELDLGLVDRLLIDLVVRRPIADGARDRFEVGHGLAHGRVVDFFGDRSLQIIDLGVAPGGLGVGADARHDQVAQPALVLEIFEARLVQHDDLVARLQLLIGIRRGCWPIAERLRIELGGRRELLVQLVVGLVLQAEGAGPVDLERPGAARLQGLDMDAGFRLMRAEGDPRWGRIGLARGRWRGRRHGSGRATRILGRHHGAWRGAPRTVERVVELDQGRQDGQRQAVIDAVAGRADAALVKHGVPLRLARPIITTT